MELVAPPMAETDRAWDYPRRGLHARDSDYRLIYEVTRRGVAEPAAQVRGDLHVRKFVFIDGSVDRNADELCNGSALGRSARRSCDVSVHCAKGHSNPRRG